MDDFDAELRSTRHRVVQFAVLVGLATCVLLALDRAPDTLAWRGPLARGAVIAGVPLLLAVFVASLRGHLAGAPFERIVWGVVSAALWAWDLDSAHRMSVENREVALLGLVHTGTVTILAAFIVLRRRTARLAAAGILGLAVVSILLAASRVPLHEQTTFSFLTLVALAAMGDALASTHETLQDHNMQARATAELAYLDQLTGLRNRRAAEEALAELGHGTGLLIVDIDHFKQINDQLGHDVGDRVLQEVADALRSAVRGDDLIARWGGEEFVVLAHDAEGATERLAQRILGTVRDLVVDPPVTVSVGTAVMRPGEAWEAALRRADEALYVAKSTGRDRAVTATVD